MFFWSDTGLSGNTTAWSGYFRISILKHIEYALYLILWLIFFEVLHSSVAYFIAQQVPSIFVYYQINDGHMGEGSKGEKMLTREGNWRRGYQNNIYNPAWRLLCIALQLSYQDYDFVVCQHYKGFLKPGAIQTFAKQSFYVGYADCCNKYVCAT